MTIYNSKDLKNLEGQLFASEAALFDAVTETGIVLGDYRSGGRNKNVARKEVKRYLDYRNAQELDPSCTTQRACVVTEVYSTPRAKEDRRGENGRYIDYLRPLIVTTDHFEGRKPELYEQWGMYERYKSLKLSPKTQYAFNPWKQASDALSGEREYKRCISYKENESLKTALDSLQKEGIVTWTRKLMFVPGIEMQENLDVVRRGKSKSEWTQYVQKQYDLVALLSEEENCVLSPGLCIGGLEVLGCYEDLEHDYLTNGGKPEIYQASPPQERWYENYQLFLRQLAYSLCNGLDKYCPITDLPDSYKFFNHSHYADTYYQLDKELKDRLLWWKTAWYEIEFQVINQEAAKKYYTEDTSGLVEGLRQEYLLFMDEHMGRRIPFEQNDYKGLGKPRIFTLNDSISANNLHWKLMSTLPRYSE